jgi:hypothetical protein
MADKYNSDGVTPIDEAGGVGSGQVPAVIKVRLAFDAADGRRCG